MVFSDEEENLNTYKKWKYNKYSKRLQTDECKARENDLAVWKCPSQEGETREHGTSVKAFLCLN